jgi:hypothetical protein
MLMMKKMSAKTKISLGLSACLLCLATAPSVGAVTIRYALIIGSNIGTDANGKQPFPPLLHAEREASLLKERLVGVSNFDSSQKRTVLLKGATTEEVQAAFKALADQKKRDEAVFSDMESIFLLYFTGHGLSGRLLLKDGPLTSRELSFLFNSVKADFSVGVFDACYAGSLDNALSEKGIRATPGLNLVRDLPSEVLSAKGSIWYVSSGSGQPSYEDDKLGGVFTHFFIEALNNAEPDGPGITLDRIWQYARSHTTSYTALRRRAQVPEEIIAKFRAKAPIYFSFPVERSATLVLSEGIEGHFALTYAEGRLTEMFEKQAGSRSRIAVYPGAVRLIQIGNSASATVEHAFTLAPGGKLVLDTMKESSSIPAVGERADVLFAKGGGIHKKVTATRIDPGISALIGAGYAFSYASKEMLNPRHLFSIPFRLDIRRVLVGINVTYGRDTRDYPAWNYTAQSAGGGISGGYGFDVSFMRISTALSFSFAHIWQTFEPPADKTAWQFHPAFSAGILMPRKGPVFAEITVDLGPVFSAGSGLDADNTWRFSGGVGVAVYFRCL